MQLRFILKQNRALIMSFPVRKFFIATDELALLESMYNHFIC